MVAICEDGGYRLHLIATKLLNVCLSQTHQYGQFMHKMQCSEYYPVYYMCKILDFSERRKAKFDAYISKYTIILITSSTR